VGQPPDERVAAQAAQAIFIMQLAEDNGRGRIDVLRQAEHSALGDGHRPDLPGSLIDVTENPLMDLPQVRQVVAGGNRRLVLQDQSRCSLGTPRLRPQPARGGRALPPRHRRRHLRHLRRIAAGRKPSPRSARCAGVSSMICHNASSPSRTVARQITLSWRSS